MWRVSSRGGRPEQVNYWRRGFPPLSRGTAGTLYYLKEDTPYGTPLMAMPVDGGPSVEIIPSVYRRHFALTRNGIYYVPFQEGSGGHELHYLSLSTGQSHRLAAIPFLLAWQLSASPDGLAVIVTRRAPESDLMLVEPFE